VFSPLQIEMLAQSRNQETIVAAEYRRMAHQNEVDERPAARTEMKLAALCALRSFNGLVAMLRNCLARKAGASVHS
jgi:hypothetical protein